MNNKRDRKKMWRDEYQMLGEMWSRKMMTGGGLT